jgi:hypothetical protein
VRAPAKTEVPALAEAEVVLLLKRIGVAEEYHTGNLRCSVCNVSIEPGHLAAIRFADGVYLFSCNRFQCLEDFHGS